MTWIGTASWGLCPQTPGIYRFFLARMAGLANQNMRAALRSRPLPFRPLNRSLGLLPSIALSRPIQVWPVSNEVPCGPTESQRVVACPKFPCLTVRVQSMLKKKN
jgi:hypothetical protein